MSSPPTAARPALTSGRAAPGPSQAHGDRLSALDGSFLRLESARSHMHVGWSAMFAEPGAGRRPTVEALRKRAAGKIHEVPWCRQRLQSAPLGLSEPRWIDDANFDLAAHIVALTDADDAVSYDRFQALRADVLSEPLDRSRPLWQVFLVPRLEDGRIGMVGKMHHALVDGIAALQIVMLVMDAEADAAAQEPVPWEPHDPPSAADWAVETLTRTAGDGLKAARAMAAAALRPLPAAGTALQGAGRLLRAVGGDILPRAPGSVLNVPIDARRTLVTYHAARKDLSAARAGGGTLNDVGLAMVAGALRALSLGRGEPSDAPLKAMMPVSMRGAGELGGGNRIAMIYIQLPVHLDAPRERLDWVREQTRELKGSDRPAANQTLVGTAALLPAPLRSPLVHAMANPRVFNLTVSQSPAPRGALYLLGSQLEEVYSVVPISAGHALAIGMVRYRQELFFGCYGDPEALPEVDDLPDLLAAELRALGAAPKADAG